MEFRQTFDCSGHEKLKVMLPSPPNSHARRDGRLRSNIPHLYPMFSLYYNVFVQNVVVYNVLQIALQVKSVILLKQFRINSSVIV